MTDWRWKGAPDLPKRGLPRASSAPWLAGALVALACGGQALSDSGRDEGTGGAGAGNGSNTSSGGSPGTAPTGGTTSGGGSDGQGTGGAGTGGAGTGGVDTGGVDTGGTGSTGVGGTDASGGSADDHSDGGVGGEMGGTGGTDLGGAAGTGAGASDGSGAADAGGTGCVSCIQEGCGPCPDSAMVYVEDGDYWIDATEVTNASYAAFLSVQPSLGIQPAECAFNGTYRPTNQWPATDRPEYAVGWVNWCDAYAYCAWAGKRLCGAIGGGPSPYGSTTDASVNQWYNACSAGGDLEYPYGDTYDADACNGGEGDRNPWLPGAHPSCEGGLDGLFDMTGNMWEWEDSCTASEGEGDFCRARGGSFWSDSHLLRCKTGTLEYERSRVNRNIGFRCCADDTEEN